MNNFIRVVNRIKLNCSKDWLTPSQEKTFNECNKFVHSYFLVNVYGDLGVGKTFLGWILKKENFGTYFSSYQAFENKKGKYTGKLILDNCSSDRIFSRNLRNLGLSIGLEWIIFITDKKVNDDVPSIKLCFTNDDSNCAKANLWRYNMIIKDDHEITNLKDLIKATEVK